MSVPKNELIEKLEEISALYADTVDIRSRMADYAPEDRYDRRVVVPQFPGEYKSEDERDAWQELIGHDEDNAVEIMDKAYKHIYCPKEPAKPNVGKRPENEHVAANTLKSKMGCLPIVAAFVAVCSLISGGLFAGDTGTVIGNLVILAVCAVAVLFFFNKYKNAQKEDEELTEVLIKNFDESMKEAEEKYEQDMNVYKTQHSAYLLSKSDFLEAYAAWREIYLDHLNEEAEIEVKLEADRMAGVNSIYEEQFVPAQKKLEACNDLVTEEYLPALSIIIDLIRSGRADDLKEAINLYEDLLYRERQLQLQREQEEQRRYEEEQRRQDEERRHREEMQFREEQERQRRYEEEQRRNDEERRRREETRAREAEARSREYQEKERIRKEQHKELMNRLDQESKQRSAGAAQCRACAHAGRCNMSIHNNAPTCTGFTPRR